MSVAQNALCHNLRSLHFAEGLGKLSLAAAELPVAIGAACFLIGYPSALLGGLKTLKAEKNPCNDTNCRKIFERKAAARVVVGISAIALGLVVTSATLLHASYTLGKSGVNSLKLAFA